jgi:hypothetical protein
MSIANGTGFTAAQLAAAMAGSAPSIILYTGTLLNVVNASTFLPLIVPTSFTSLLQFKDMGKLLVIQSNGQDVYRFRLVQTVNGPTTEGVPSTDPFYVCVWSADPAVKSVVVARTG